MANEMTLLEAAKLMEPSRTAGVLSIYAQAYQPLQVAPVLRSTGIWKWGIEGTQPTTAARDVNADFTNTQGIVQQYQSETKAYGGKIAVDRKIVVESPNAVASQESMLIKSLARKTTIDLFEAAGGSSFYGLRTLMENQTDFAGQTVAAASSNTAAITLDMVDALTSKVNIIPGKTFLYANDFVIRSLKSLSRAPVANSIGVNRELNQFGVYSGSYGDIGLVSMIDGKGANMLSVIEADADANETDACSAYLVTWGEEMAALHSSNSGTGANGIPIPDVTYHEDGTNYKYARLEWFIAPIFQTIRCAARLRYLTPS